MFELPIEICVGMCFCHYSAPSVTYHSLAPCQQQAGSIAKLKLGQHRPDEDVRFSFRCEETGMVVRNRRNSYDSMRPSPEERPDGKALAKRGARRSRRPAMNETTDGIRLRPLGNADCSWLAQLNEACVPAVNPLDDAAIATLVRHAAWVQLAERAGKRLAVLVGFTKGSNYESTNYAWFNAQDEAFAYIDRVMVDAAGRGQGLGSRLYSAFADWAAEQALPRLCCEVNEVPPNPVSLAFHKALGFRVLTSRINPADGKRVAMMEKRLRSGNGQE